jgi:hypothetical protein
MLGPFITVFATRTQARVQVRFGLSTGAAFTWPLGGFTTVPTALRWIASATPARSDPRIVLADARFANGDRIANPTARFSQLQFYPPAGGVTP